MLTTTIVGAAEVRRLDIEAMHSKVRSIFETIKATPNVILAKKHSVKFYDNDVIRISIIAPRCIIYIIITGRAVLCIIRIILYYVLSYIVY